MGLKSIALWKHIQDCIDLVGLFSRGDRNQDSRMLKEMLSITTASTLERFMATHDRKLFGAAH